MIAMTLAIILAAGGAYLIFDGAMGMAVAGFVAFGSGDDSVDRDFLRSHGLRVFVFGPALILAALAVARWG